MRIFYDPEADALRICLIDAEAVESEEMAPDIILDYAKDGRVVSIEALHASKHAEEVRDLDKLVKVSGEGYIANFSLRQNIQFLLKRP